MRLKKNKHNIRDLEPGCRIPLTKRVSVKAYFDVEKNQNFHHFFYFGLFIIYNNPNVNRKMKK